MRIFGGFLVGILILGWFFAPTSSGFGPGGTLTTILATDGHPNPPGYQVIGILGQLWNFWPTDNPALHFNRLAVLLGVVLLGLLGEVVYRWTKGSWIATFISIGLLLGSAGFQKHFLFFDRYSTAAIAMLLCLRGIDRIQEVSTNRRWFVLGLVATLALISHLYVFLAVIVYLLLALPLRKILKLKSLSWGVLGGLSGTTVLFWSFLKGFGDSFLNWGQIQSFQALWLHFFRYERGTLSLGRSSEKLTRQLAMAFQEFQLQMGGWILPVLVLGGLFYFAKERKVRALLISSLALAFISFGSINFSIGSPGSGLEMTTGWYYRNYLFFFHLMMALAFGFLVHQCLSAKFLKITAVVVGLSSSWIFGEALIQTHDYAQELPKLLDYYPKGSVVFSQTDSFVFPVEMLRLRGKAQNDVLLLHTYLLARSWYLKSLVKEARISQELIPEIEATAQFIDEIDQGIALSPESGERLIALQNKIVEFYEQRGGAFLLEFPELDPLPYFVFSKWNQEPWGLGVRLFQQNNETKEIQWQNVETLLEPRCHIIQEFWCQQLTREFQRGLQRRMEFVGPIFPSEAQDIKRALHL